MTPVTFCSLFRSKKKFDENLMKIGTMAN